MRSACRMDDIQRDSDDVQPPRPALAPWYRHIHPLDCLPAGARRMGHKETADYRDSDVATDAMTLSENE